MDPTRDRSEVPPSDLLNIIHGYTPKLWRDETSIYALPGIVGVIALKTFPLICSKAIQLLNKLKWINYPQATPEMWIVQFPSLNIAAIVVAVWSTFSYLNYVDNQVIFEIQRCKWALQYAKLNLSKIEVENLISHLPADLQKQISKQIN